MKALKESQNILIHFCRYSAECRDFRLGDYACLHGGEGCQQAEEQEMEGKIKATP